MLTRFLQLLGVGDDILARLDRAVLAFQRPGLLAVGLALLLPAGWFIIRRQRHNLATATPALRAALDITRLGVLLVLVIVVAGPYLKIDYEIEKRPVVALLFDRSASMQLPSGPFATSDEAGALATALSGQQAAESPHSISIQAEKRAALETMTRAKLAEAIVSAGRKAFLDPMSRRFEVRAYAFARQSAPVELRESGAGDCRCGAIRCGWHTPG